MDDSAVRAAARRDCRRAVVRAKMVAAALRQNRARPRRGHAGYYIFILRDTAQPRRDTAHEYVSFIALVGSLFVVSGGIHIGVKGGATPFENVIFLFAGAVIANVLGTTGAAMLLIRPWIRMNQYRVTAHHIVFFIFIVANVGGCLTPIGDPPLFLGYLQGVPFWWVAEKLLADVGDRRRHVAGDFLCRGQNQFHPRAAWPCVKWKPPPKTWRFDGLANLFFLAVILGAVFVQPAGFSARSIDACRRRRFLFHDQKIRPRGEPF